VHPASVQERAGGEALLARAEAWAGLRAADEGPGGPRYRRGAVPGRVRGHRGWEPEVVATPPEQKGVTVPQRRWMVERSFG